ELPLAFRLSLKLNLSILHFDRVHHRLAVVLLANLGGLFPDERRERFEVAGNFFSQLSLGLAKRQIQRFDLLSLRQRARALDRERPIAPRRLGDPAFGATAEAIHRMVLRFPLL